MHCSVKAQKVHETTTKPLQKHTKNLSCSEVLMLRDMPPLWMQPSDQGRL